MKSTRKSIIVMAVVLAVLFAVSSVAMAKGYGRGGHCAGQGFGGPGFGAIQGLNLSEEQRDQALKIMESHQIDMIKARGTLVKERDNLRKALESDPLNEQDVRAAHKKLSSLREDRLVARAKMMNKLRAILTPEQVKLLDERKAARFDRSEAWGGHGRSFAGGWSGDCPRW